MSYDFLLTIAIIMLFTKVFGLTSERVHMPQVVGALIAGVLVGPSCLGWVGETDFLVKAAEIGVIILMFNAGMDTDLDELKTTGFVLHYRADRCYRAADRWCCMLSGVRQ